MTSVRYQASEIATGDREWQYRAYDRPMPIWYKQPDDTPSVSPNITVELIDDLLVLYTFRDYVTVSRYLFLYPQLGSFLLEASAQIKRLTGIRYPVLEVISDPDGGPEKLYILLPTSLPVPDAVRIIRHLDEVWWLDACEQAGNIVNIDLTYV